MRVRLLLAPAYRLQYVYAFARMPRVETRFPGGAPALRPALEEGKA